MKDLWNKKDTFRLGGADSDLALRLSSFYKKAPPREAAETHASPCLHIDMSDVVCPCPSAALVRRWRASLDATQGPTGQ